ncbi:MAG: hypothetical protein H6625_06095 [Bdellovibrionaceae bacterium]|nr:hypothetical protein [Pseudobdellovibrionaceae bacterium]
MFKASILIFLIVSHSGLSKAKTPGGEKVQIAFLEFYNQEGTLVSLERGGRFGHVAISYKGGWLHSYPPRPVEWVPDLNSFGVVSEIFDVYHLPNYNDEFFAKELGKISTIDSEWEDTESTYCAKLVGQILGIPPRPNKWDAPIWRQQELETYSEFGLSPDDIYEHLIANKNQSHVNYISSSGCNQLLQ